MAGARSAGELYDAIGAGYGAGRRPDPRIGAAIHAALGDAETVLNVGAGTGSYEPAEALPFEDDSFDVAPDAAIAPVPIPWDCEDAFFHAFWRRPEMYLRAEVRSVTSVWARVGPEVEARAVAALAADLESGAWRARNGELSGLEECDVGARLVVAETAG